MADEADQITEVEGAAEAPSVVAEPDAPAGWDGWGDLAEDDIVKRHGGDPVKMAQSYKALTKELHAREYTARQEPAAEAEPETPWEPGQDWSAPAGVDPVFYGKVANNYQVDPVGTLRELVAGGDDYVVYAEQVYNALEEQVGRFRAQRILGQIQYEQQQAETEALLAERVDARVTPITNEAMTGKVNAGIDLAKDAMGAEAWAEFEPYLSSVVPTEGLPKHVVDSPTLLRDTLMELRDWQVYKAQAKLNAAATAPEPTPAPARRGAQATLAGSTASRPDEQSYADKVKADLKTTKIRITD